MTLNVFYNNIEPIVLKDELAEFLGFPEDGIIKIHYHEIVKMAGHSCVTVAGAYLMAYKGLKALYGNDMPKRGEIKVELRDSIADGSNGVVAAVLSNITGAATENGFGGLAGNFSRKNLIYNDVAIDGVVRFTRMDTAKSVEVSYNPAKAVQPGNVMMTAIGPQATDESRKNFPKKWQEVIKTIFENMDAVVEVT